MCVFDERMMLIICNGFFASFIIIFFCFFIIGVNNVTESRKHRSNIRQCEGHAHCARVQDYVSADDSVTGYYVGFVTSALFLGRVISSFLVSQLGHAVNHFIHTSIGFIK